jgi:hypothetical protein
MKADRFEDFRNLASQSGVLFYYQGTFQSQVVDAMGQQLQHRLASEGVTGPARRRVFSTFVEMAHNVMHYGRDAHSDSSGTARIGVISMGVQCCSEAAADAVPDHWVLCANLVHRDDIPRISAKLDAIRSMSQDEVRANYKQQLRNDAHGATDEISKGAGLGLLTIARDSKQPVEYSFASTAEPESGLALFFMRTVI